MFISVPRQGVGSCMAHHQCDGAGGGLVLGELPAAGPRAEAGGSLNVHCKARRGTRDGEVAVLDRGEGDIKTMKSTIGV
jgi:hypothetical protein